MARDFHINGESMVFVKGAAGTLIASLTQLGLADSPIVVTPRSHYADINVDAWGGREVPVDVQYKLSDITVQINLIHYDREVLRTCLQLSMGGGLIPGGIDGALGRTGTRLGGGVGRFAAGNSYIGLNIASPVDGLPWRFYYAYLADNPATYPLGAEKSVVQTVWRVVPYTNDPWGGGTAQPNTVAGTGSAGAVLFDHVLDT